MVKSATQKVKKAPKTKIKLGTKTVKLKTVNAPKVKVRPPVGSTRPHVSSVVDASAKVTVAPKTPLGRITYQPTSKVSPVLMEQIVAKSQPKLPTTISSKNIPLLLETNAKGSAFGKTVKATKSARIHAVEAKGGEVVTTTLKNGFNEVESRVANAGDWIVTNPGGEKYIVATDVFAKTYQALGNGEFISKGEVRKFVQITQDMDLVVEQWGGEVQHLKKGAYLNITNPADIYGVAEEEFHQTHQIIADI